MVQITGNGDGGVMEPYEQQKSTFASREVSITSVKTPKKKCERRRSKRSDCTVSIKAAKSTNVHLSERQITSEMQMQWLQNSPRFRPTQHRCKGSSDSVQSRPPSRQKHAFPVHLDEAWSSTQEIYTEYGDEFERPPSRGVEGLWSSLDAPLPSDRKCHTSQSKSERNLTTTCSNLCIDDEVCNLGNELESTFANNCEQSNRIKAQKRAIRTAKDTDRWTQASTRIPNDLDRCYKKNFDETFPTEWAVTRNTFVSNPIPNNNNTQGFRSDFERTRNPNNRVTKQPNCKPKNYASRKLKTSLSDDFLSLFAPS